jgi:DNA-binding PadR family transcriptional regulator
VGYVTAQAEGAKKLYTITDEGRAHLQENRDFVDAVLGRLAAVGDKIARMRQRETERDEERNAPNVPPLVRAALVNLRDVASKRLAEDADAEAKIVEVLARVAGELKRS